MLNAQDGADGDTVNGGLGSADTGIVSVSDTVSNRPWRASQVDKEARSLPSFTLASGSG